jgi:pimeloyl-ACP methyl ester carboxylesterase
MNFIYKESHLLDAEACSSVPGQFVELADGVTHYEIAGPPDGQVVVLLHGFFNAYFVWDDGFNALAQAGFRVLRYDLYGRGYSDRPNVRYDGDLFEQQLVNLLAALDITQPVDLVGPSMGGAIALTFVDRHPTAVRRLCLIDPSGLYPKHQLMVNIMRIPVLGELLIAQTSKPEKFPEEIQDFLKYQGTRRAFLSTIRHGPFGSISDVYERVGKQEIPTVLMWGREDEAIPFEFSEKVKQALPRAEFHAIDGAGHKPYYERPDLVNPLLIEFLNRPTVG